MSRITDYILEPKVVYTEGGFLVRVKVQDDYKYKKYIVSENLHYKTVQGTSFTLTDAQANKQASITELKGNTTQEGTPTPSSPVEVNTVSGDNNVVVSNKNLIANNIETQEINGLTITKGTDGSLLINGTSNNTTRLNLMENFVIENGSYVWSSNANGTVSNNCYLSLIKTGTTTEVSGSAINLKSATIKTITISETTNTYVRFYVSSGITFTNFKIYPMLEKGNQATTYLAHQGNSYRVDLGGKNITSPQNVQTAQNVVNTLNDDGSITSIGTPNTGYFNITSARSFELPIGTYTFSINTTRQYLTALSLENESGTKESKYIRIGDKSVTFTTTEKKVKFYFWSYATNGTPVNETIYFQLEEGSTATPYSPYTSNPIELCKIGNYQDKIYYNSGKWYIEKNIGKVVLNENSNIIKYDNYGRYYISGILATKGSTTSPNAMSNYFNGVFAIGNGNIFSSGVDGTINMINTSYLNDLAGFKTWLGTTTPIVYYVLATPTYTEITDTYLLEQLNNILDIELYEDLCYVDWIGSIAPNMTLQYAGTEDLGIKYIITEDGKKIRTDWRKLGRRKNGR